MPERPPPANRVLPSNDLDGLSERQRQILELLRAGKINKEIAHELGIGLGTVKQHVVALFKKLNVRNRTMAISRTASQTSHPAVAELAEKSLLEQRPCVVLSFFLDAPDEGGVGRMLHQMLAAHAYDHDAIFLARKGCAGDMILGIQRASEALVTKALRAAAQLDALLGERAPDKTMQLRCGLAAGLAMASVQRQGGWTGEAIASAAIARARDLALAAPPGHVRLDSAAQTLLGSLDPATTQPVTDAFALASLGACPWQPRGDISALPLVGRKREQACLAEALDWVLAGTGRRIGIEGETGMGKTSLCRHVVAMAEARNFAVTQILCLDAGTLFDQVSGRPANLEAIAAKLGEEASGRPYLWVIDDCHLLSAQDIAALHACPPARGHLLVLSGRRLPRASDPAEQTLHLPRLSDADTRRIVATHSKGVPVDRQAEMARQAAGVPLFAVELARTGESLPLSLRMVISGRMDRLRLDRLLLRQVAVAPGHWSIDQLTHAMREPHETVCAAADKAVASGVLCRDDATRLSFSHPLLRQVILEAKVE